MNNGTTLRWRRHRRAGGAGAAAVAGGPAVAVPAADEIDLPELPESPRAKAVTLLRVAAQVEHALMVQYLYAGNSFSRTQRDVVGVAIEEMSHLMTVQNLLRCIGEKPYLHRQDYGPPTAEDERLFPFDLRLEPLTHLSLAKYVVAESPASPAGVDPVLLARIVDLATAGVARPVNRVGTLYTLLSAVLGTEQLLLELAATGDPWYVEVNRFAAEAATFYGGRDALHLPDGDLDPGSVSGQASDRDWDRSVEKDIDEFRVHVAASRRDALEALRDIGLQGEGPSPVATENSHFRRFYDLFVRFFGADGSGTGPAPQVLDVPAGAAIVLDESGTGDNVISEPTTMRWARLADLRYALLLGALERYLLADPDDRAFLRGWCFAEMFALRKLAEFLRALPRSTTGAPQVAALPFTLPPWSTTSVGWSDLAGAFDESMTIARGLRDEIPAGSPLRRLLVLLLASDERKLAESRARASGASERTRADDVRDALDWAAGAGDPGHSAQGRFWNLQRDDFVQVKVFGANVTTIPGPGEDAPMVDMLRSRIMPQDRPKLDEDSPEFLVVEKWVADGCPDEKA